MRPFVWSSHIHKTPLQIGCEYRLSETEILDWLNCFGEVLSEIMEERFDSEDLSIWILDRCHGKVP